MTDKLEQIRGKRNNNQGAEMIAEEETESAPEQKKKQAYRTDEQGQ
jgi:hypothetical protein